MAQNIYIKDADNYSGQTVTVTGWVYNLRSSGSIIFLQIRDGSGFIQGIIARDEINDSEFKKAQNLNIEAAITCTGLIQVEPRSPTGFELKVTGLEILSNPKDEYPIGKKEHGPDFLLTNRHLWLRSKRQWAIMRIRNQVIFSIHEFLAKKNYIQIDTPIITPSACEGTTTLFEIDYFGEPAYITQSGQLYLEAAIFSFGKCYDFGPVMRAEKSKTRRHLIEFWMIDVETAFMNFEQNLDLQEQFIKYLVDQVLDKCRTEFKIIARDTSPLVNIKLPFLRLTYDETMKKLKEMGSKTPYGSDLGNEDETILMNYYKSPVFITNYPAKVKAFYFKTSPENSEFALAADLLAPEGYGEIVGGGEREDDYDTLVKSIKKHNLNIADFKWYLDLRKYGSAVHSGFGLGLERIISWICHLEHVREAIPFPRLLDRFRP